MPSFSQRMGITPLRVEIQKESIDHELKNALWNALYIVYFDNLSFHMSHNPKPIQTLFRRIWMHQMHKAYDDTPEPVNIVLLIKEQFFRSQWYEVLDIVEFIPRNYDLEEYNGGNDNERNTSFYELCNHHFERYLSAYRFVSGQLTEITSNEEIASIEDVLNNASVVSSARTHMKRSLELFSDRNNPDYRNSIKESISAVESCCRTISQDNKATLGKALAVIEKKHGIHGSLKTAFTALYGYTSDAEGIRHALLDESDLKQEDAKFMLVACSAFVNYLTVKNSI
jgi:hypothetical protein